MGLGFSDGFAFWEHYCKVQNDIMGFKKGSECDWCGAKESEIDSSILDKGTSKDS